MESFIAFSQVYLLNSSRTCKDIENAYTIFLLTLMLSNTATVCLPSFLGTVTITKIYPFSVLFYKNYLF